MTEPMSNELIVHTLKDIQENVREIKIQTQKTNGTVKELQQWRSFITGGLAVVTALIVPVFLAMVYLAINNFFK